MDTDTMKNIPMMIPDINDADIAEVVKVLKSGNLVHGVNCLKLEEEIAKLIGVNHVSVVANGTASLILALKVLGIGEGDEVIIPALSFVATANAVELVGATPVFVDVEIDTFNIDVNQIEAKITSKTKAIMPVHEFGLACDIEKVASIGEQHGLYIVEDAACALGASVNGKMVGSFGQLASFSLHPRKAITSGEGGIVVMNDKSLHDKVNQLRNHGIHYADSIEFVEAGYNFRLTDFQASLVLSQLGRFKQQINDKRKVADMYLKGINSPLIKLPTVPSYTEHTWQTFHVILDEKLDRKEIINNLKQKNIGSGPGAQCIPEVSFYKKKYNLNSETEFPNASLAYHQGLAIPMYANIGEEEVQYVIDNLNQIK